MLGIPVLCTVLSLLGAVDEGTVSGTGTSVSKRLPEFLRMKVEVFARGKTMSEALANLKDRKEAILGFLTKSGALESSIKFAAPQVNVAILERLRQMEAMIRARMADQGNKNPKNDAKAASPVVISVSLTADWPLKGKAVEDLLVAAAPVLEKLKAADLPGKKELEKPGGDDEEMREELEGVEANLNTNGDNGAQAVEPAFVFVSKVSKEMQGKALAEAFQKARASAEALARAAGAELGSIRQLSGSVQAGTVADEPEGPNNAELRLLQQNPGFQSDGSSDASEAIGPQPGAVTYTVTVVATFALK